MSNFYTIKQRLAKLEQRANPAPKIGKLAASGFFDTDEGKLFLEAQPPERREALLSADHFSCTDMERAAPVNRRQKEHSSYALLARQAFVAQPPSATYCTGTASDPTT